MFAMIVCEPFHDFAIQQSPFNEYSEIAMDPRAAKSSLRLAIKDRLAQMSAKDHHAESTSLCRRILEQLPPAPMHLTAFFPLKDEVDIRPLLIALHERGDVLYLPRFESGKMVFRKAESLTDLPPGAFGIPEPPPTAPLLAPTDLTIALVPARAFNRKGERLGRGNGGYDIWIRAQRTANPRTQFWGICFERQLVDQIPMESHDEQVDAIVTARGITRKSA